MWTEIFCIFGGVLLGVLLTQGAARLRTNPLVDQVDFTAEELQRYRRSQVFANIGTWDWSVKSDVLHWSDEIYRMFGYEPGEVTPTYQLFI